MSIIQRADKVDTDGFWQVGMQPHIQGAELADSWMSMAQTETTCAVDDLTTLTDDGKGSEAARIPTALARPEMSQARDAEQANLTKTVLHMPEKTVQDLPEKTVQDLREKIVQDLPEKTVQVLHEKTVRDLPSPDFDKMYSVIQSVQEAYNVDDKLIDQLHETFSDTERGLDDCMQSLRSIQKAHDYNDNLIDELEDELSDTEKKLDHCKHSLRTSIAEKQKYKVRLSLAEQTIKALRGLFRLSVTTKASLRSSTPAKKKYKDGLSLAKRTTKDLRGKTKRSNNEGGKGKKQKHSNPLHRVLHGQLSIRKRYPSPWPTPRGQSRSSGPKKALNRK